MSTTITLTVVLSAPTGSSAASLGATGLNNAVAAYLGQETLRQVNNAVPEARTEATPGTAVQTPVTLTSSAFA
jgi:hypothetical protein